MTEVRKLIEYSRITQEDITLGKLFTDQRDGEVIMLAYIGSDELACISIKDGTIWGVRITIEALLLVENLSETIYTSDTMMRDLFEGYGLENLKPIELESRGW